MTNTQNTAQLPEATPLERLYTTLEEEIQQYESTVEKLTRKNQILVSGKPQQLTRLDQELLALSRKATQLEKQRLGLMAELGYPNCTLSHFMTQLAPTHVSSFTLCRDRLLRAVQDVQKLNRSNQDLLDLSLIWIRDTVEVIANAITPEGASYNAQGTKSSQQSQGSTLGPIQSTINCSG